MISSVRSASTSRSRRQVGIVASIDLGVAGLDLERLGAGGDPDRRRSGHRGGLDPDPRQQGALVVRADLGAEQAVDPRRAERDAWLRRVVGGVSTAPGATWPPAHSAMSRAVRSAPTRARRHSWPFSKRRLASDRSAYRKAVRRMLIGSKMADSTTTFVVPSPISDVRPPMTPAIPIGPRVVGDDQGVRVQLALDVVERLERAPPRSPAGR